ncbi:unnamed protein product [Rotaria magnacalcarata]
MRTHKIIFKLDTSFERCPKPIAAQNLFLFCQFRIMSWSYVSRNFDSVDRNLTEIIENVEVRDRNNLYGNYATANNLNNVDPIRTRSEEETYRYVQEAVGKIYWSSNPNITRSPSEGPVRSEKQVTLKCLQPPALPEPEPNIIIEKRPEQPPPQPPVIIHQREQICPTPEPLIFRERPPVRPVPPPPQKTEICLPPVPVPPRSLIVECFPPMEKPRDIIIERWLPYGPFPERRTITQPAPPPVKYPSPTHTVIIHDKGPVVVVDKFQCLGVSQEDPDAYIARYGSSLLDSRTLVEEVCRAGVTANITCPCDALPPRFDDPRLRSPCVLRNDRWCLKHGTSCPKLRDGTQHFNIGNGEGSYDCETN